MFENLRVVAEASEKSGPEDIERSLERFPRLRKILDRPAGFLSGGEAQQLAIARALVTRPRLLLLDEPTEGIQPSIILEIEDAIADLKADGMSILLVEQYVDFAMRLADTYAVMDVGRIVASGPTETFERAKHAAAHVGVAALLTGRVWLGARRAIRRACEVVVDNSSGGDAQLAASVTAGLRDRGHTVEVLDPEPASMFDTAVHVVSTGIVLRVDERPRRAELDEISTVVREALMRHPSQRRRTRAVPVEARLRRPGAHLDRRLRLSCARSRARAPARRRTAPARERTNVALRWLSSRCTTTPADERPAGAAAGSRSGPGRRSSRAGCAAARVRDRRVVGLARGGRRAPGSRSATVGLPAAARQAGTRWGSVGRIWLTTIRAPPAPSVRSVQSQPADQQPALLARERLDPPAAGAQGRDVRAGRDEDDVGVVAGDEVRIDPMAPGVALLAGAVELLVDDMAIDGHVVGRAAARAWPGSP